MKILALLFISSLIATCQSEEAARKARCAKQQQKTAVKAPPPPSPPPPPLPIISKAREETTVNVPVNSVANLNNAKTEYAGTYIDQKLPLPRKTNLTCNDRSCSRAEGIWGEWTLLTQCNDTCGGCGRRTKQRVCLSEKFGIKCQGEPTKVEVCGLQVCLLPRLSCCPPFFKLIIPERRAFGCGPLVKEDDPDEYMQKQIVIPPKSLEAVNVPVNSVANQNNIKKGIWSSWQIMGSQDCFDTCGACATWIRYRQCISEKDGVKCEGSSAIEESCGLKICTYPRLECCDGYSKAVYGRQFVCARNDKRLTDDVKEYYYVIRNITKEEIDALRSKNLNSGSNGNLVGSNKDNIGSGSSGNNNNNNNNNSNNNNNNSDAKNINYSSSYNNTYNEYFYTHENDNKNNVDTGNNNKGSNVNNITIYNNYLYIYNEYDYSNFGSNDNNNGNNNNNNQGNNNKTNTNIINTYNYNYEFYDYNYKGNCSYSKNDTPEETARKKYEDFIAWVRDYRMDPATDYPGTYYDRDLPIPRNTTISCNDKSCSKAEGIWGEWTLLTKCNDTCGSNGRRTKQRICLSEKFGVKCQGEPTKREVCGVVACLFPRKSCALKYQKWFDKRTKNFICGPIIKEDSPDVYISKQIVGADSPSVSNPHPMPPKKNGSCSGGGGRGGNGVGDTHPGATGVGGSGVGGSGIGGGGIGGSGNGGSGIGGSGIGGSGVGGSGIGGSGIGGNGVGGGSGGNVGPRLPIGGGGTSNQVGAPIPVNPPKPTPTNPPYTGVCDNIAKFPTTDPCWQKWKGKPQKDVCYAQATLKDASQVWDRFVGAICQCDSSSDGDGFYCESRCSPDQLVSTTCSDALMCLVNITTKVPGCLCPAEMTYKNGQCVETVNACSSCRFDCHAASKCMPPESRVDKYECGDCDVSLGYKGVAGNCKNIDECDPTKPTHKCDPNAKCTDTYPLLDANWAKYTCTCKAGWNGGDATTGTLCKPCQDFDECAANKTLCGGNSVCRNTPGSYVCDCVSGYKLSNGVCVDVDECLENPCSPHSTCKNLPGSYECPCNAGFVGDGKTSGCEADKKICSQCDNKTTTCVLNPEKTVWSCNCIANHTRVNELKCTPNTYCNKPEQTKCAPIDKATCTDHPDGSGYDCKCKEAFQGDGMNCTSKSVCLRTFPCAGVKDTICKDSPTKPETDYTCECKPNYIRQLEGLNNNSAPCFEKDRYIANNCTLCDKNTEQCMSVPDERNVNGSLKSCYCAKGYTKGPNGMCTNINECSQQQLNDCDKSRAVCIDIIPHTDPQKKLYECKCIAGYAGAGTVGTCHNVDECDERNKLKVCTGPNQKCLDEIPGYKCVCEPGYKMLDGNCNDIDECSAYTHNCIAFNLCVNKNGSYDCVCMKGFEQTGTDAKTGRPICTSIDYCTKGLANGKPACDPVTEICVPQQGTFECACAKGFRKVNRECVDINECQEKTATCELTTTYCENTEGGYSCNCKDGYQENNDKMSCVDYDECATKNFTCQANSHCFNIAPGYKCICDDGYEVVRGSNPLRPYCQHVKVCETNPFLCNDGDCIDTSTAPFFKCECSVGTIEFNGTFCIDSKFCDKTDVFKCPDKSTCQGRGKCTCDKGYKWVDLPLPITLDAIKTKRQCKEVDWCVETGRTQCTNMMCRSTPAKGPGTGECYCAAGYEMINNQCDNINECLDPKNKDICSAAPHSHCEDTPGAYTCECDTGFYKSPKSVDPKKPICLNVDECLLTMDNCTKYKNTVCKDNEGSFQCDCQPGYKRDQIGEACKAGSPCYLRGCEDIDECEAKMCDDKAICKNFPGGYTCTCPAGYRGKGDKASGCNDINECLEGSHNCTQFTESCVNTPGSFKCDCNPGYEKVGGICTDINECIVGTNNCTKEETCKNKPGKYYCKCKDGFLRNSKTKLCDDVDECTLPGSCPYGPGDICKNSVGAYNCSCAAGFQKPPECAAKPTTCGCMDVDECTLGKPDGSAFCSNNALCKNTVGSATCDCKSGFAGDAYAKDGCKPVDVCTLVKCPPNSQCVSRNYAPGYRCVCNEGYEQTNFTVMCQENPCKSRAAICKNGTCVTKPNIATGTLEAACRCGAGQVLQNSTNTCVPEDKCKCGSMAAYPCLNSSICSDPPNMYCSLAGDSTECKCVEGRLYNPTTKKCDDKDECLFDKPPPCPTGTTCRNLPDGLGFLCECPVGQLFDSTTRTCVVDVLCSLQNYCATKISSKCNNGSCACPEGTTEKNAKCVVDDPCVTWHKKNPGVKSKCGDNAVEDGGGYDECKCFCIKGYVKSSNGSCIDDDECARKPCSTEEKPFCANTPGSFYCHCTEKNYEIVAGKCQPVDLCKDKKPPCEPVTSTCEPLTGNCICNKGYRKNATGGCVDVDECFDGTYSCTKNSHCVNTKGSYECVCDKGYEKKGDPFTCNDIDECKNPTICPKGSTCTNLDGDYRCVCQIPLIQYSNYDCAANTTLGCETKCAKHAHCIKVLNQMEVYNCTCDYGYEGVDATKNCTNVNECKDPNSCAKNATCTDLEGSYTCACNPPFTGDGKSSCYPINYCKDFNTCPADANCIQLQTPVNGKYIDCICKTTGFSYNSVTNTCDDVDECKNCTTYPNCPCPKTALKCINTPGSYKCECDKGYAYNAATNECLNVDECKLGLIGSCTPQVGKCVDTPGSWYCKCNDGFKNPATNNQTCEIDYYCNTTRNTCDAKTTICQELFPGFSCKCKDGYAKYAESDKNCSDVNECLTNRHNCSVNEECTNLVPGFFCNCSNGYERDAKNVCTPLKPCDKPCPEYSMCRVNKNGTSECMCNTGYIYHEDIKSCVIVPCNSTNDCPAHSQCLLDQYNNQTDRKEKGTYQCICDPSYEKNANGFCIPIDPCRRSVCGAGTCEPQALPPFYACKCPATLNTNNKTSCEPQKCTDKTCDKNANCEETNGGTVCRCKEGYSGAGTLTDICTPIDGCATNPCSKYGKCDSSVPGKYSCTCNRGYKGNGTWCINVDECTEKGPAGEVLHNCDVNAKCDDRPGSFVCTCNKGWFGLGDIGHCTDVDECVDPTKNDCDPTSTKCINTPGSYKCQCKEGFRNTTAPNKCEAIKQCEENNKNNELCGIHKCNDLIPGYECICLQGYDHFGNRSVCLDIDECTLKTAQCCKNAKCYNTIGSYSCQCLDGYEGDGVKNCSLIDRCKTKDNNCDLKTTKCEMLSDRPQHKCTCLPGYEVAAGQMPTNTCTDIDECSNKSLYNCTTDICTNTPGSYEITCKPGYVDTLTPADPKKLKVKCEPLNECAMDPAYQETLTKLKTNTLSETDWQKIMVPPKNNASGYAACYYNALNKDKGSFGGVQTLPMCMDLAPNMPFEFTSPSLKPVGFGCTCLTVNLTKDVRPYATLPQCLASTCTCEPDFVCKSGRCACADPTKSMIKDGNVSKCAAYECNNEYKFPEKLKNDPSKTALLVCDMGTFKFKALQGFEIVRDNVTGEILDVRDIDECAGTVNPCCSSSINCTNKDTCVQCVNTVGSFACQLAGRVCSDPDKNTCECRRLECGSQTAWFYECGKGCNASRHPALDKPEYQKPVCSRITTQNEFKTFRTLKDLYTAICMLTFSNQNGIAGESQSTWDYCTFDSSDADLTRSPLFNYWGECTPDLTKVKCEGGAAPQSTISLNVNGSYCPLRPTLWEPTIKPGQPFGAPFPQKPLCLSYAEVFLSGKFAIRDQYFDLRFT